MAEGINVRFAGPLHRFIQHRTGPGGIYQSASEYIRDLVRHDFQLEEERCGEALYQQLKAGAEAPIDDFIALDVESVIRDAKERRAATK